MSSVIAAWADISDVLALGDPAVAEAGALVGLAGAVSKMNAGYFWMFLNCATSAAYVRLHLRGPHMSKTLIEFTGLDNEEEDQVDWVLRLGYDDL